MADDVEKIDEQVREYLESIVREQKKLIRMGESKKSFGQGALIMAVLSLLFGLYVDQPGHAFYRNAFLINGILVMALGAWRWDQGKKILEKAYGESETKKPPAKKEPPAPPESPEPPESTDPSSSDQGLRRVK